MPSLLITGANRGIGLEFARQYAMEGWTVFATVRDTAKAGALLALRGEVAVLEMDVADPASIGVVAERLQGTPLDLLINNAGVFGEQAARLGAIDYESWRQVLAVNTLGPMRVTEAFLPHLRAGRQKKIATLTSKMGSMAENTSGDSYAYRSSKAAVNAVMKSLAIDLAGEGFAVVVLNPGWVRTAMGGPGATLEPRDSVIGMRRIIEELTVSGTGRFLHYDGQEIRW